MTFVVVLITLVTRQRSRSLAVGAKVNAFWLARGYTRIGSQEKKL